jgi:hypothetical protein
MENPMPSRKPPQRHIVHAGYSIPAGAAELKMPEGLMRRAVANGEVEVVDFAGLRRIPPREIERLRKLFGKGQEA